MDFRLIYRGKLPSASSSDTRAKEKHSIRKQLHGQLRALWQDHPALLHHFKPGKDNAVSEIDVIGEEYSRDGYRFIPLIRKRVGLACSLNILFLRRDAPGGLIKSGGDIDNRLKVLLDGLRMPQSIAELAGFLPEQGEDPFFCLLEDDVLINDIGITTDRLLTPQLDSEHIHDVLLVIHVSTKPTRWNSAITFGF